MPVYKYESSRRRKKLTGSKLAVEGGEDSGKPQSNI